jgi:hypothetical protein
MMKTRAAIVVASFLLLVWLSVSISVGSPAAANIASTAAVANYLPLIMKPASTPAPVPTPTLVPPPTPVPPPSGANVVCEDFGSAQLCAWVSNGNPARFSTVTVYGRYFINGAPVAGQPMATTWHYATTTPTCNDGVTGPDGIASCARSIGGATSGFQVNVVVEIGGNQVTTWFTPQ